MLVSLKVICIYLWVKVGGEVRSKTYEKKITQDRALRNSIKGWAQEDLHDLFVHSGYFHSTSSCPLQHRSAPTKLGYCVTLHAESLQATASEGLDHGPNTWRLERDSILRPSERKAPNLPMSYHVPQTCCYHSKHLCLQFIVCPFRLARLRER